MNTDEHIFTLNISMTSALAV